MGGAEIFDRTTKFEMAWQTALLPDMSDVRLVIFMIHRIASRLREKLLLQFVQATTDEHNGSYVCADVNFNF